jgi:hypothetical protein
MGNNLLSDRAAQAFSEALAHNSHLEGLSLWKNSILSAGAQYLVRGLGHNTSLRWLGLGALRAPRHLPFLFPRRAPFYATSFPMLPLTPHMPP